MMSVIKKILCCISIFIGMFSFGLYEASYGQTTELKAINPSTLPPAHGYSHVVITPPGQLVSISGQVAMDSTGTVVGVGNFAAQCEQVFKNLRRALHSVGLTFADVVRTDMYVTSLDYLSELRKCRARYLPADNPLPLHW